MVKFRFANFNSFFYHTPFYYIQMKNVLLTIGIHTLFELVVISLRPCHTLPDSANGRVTDSEIICPFMSVRVCFLSLPHAVNAFLVR